MPTAAAVQQLWIWSLVIYAVVVGVVALLLTLILIEVRRIHQDAASIWTVGQKVANNTIQIALLVKTNQVVNAIKASAVRTAGAVAAIERHAAGCPGCPACVIGKGGARS